MKVTLSVVLLFLLVPAIAVCQTTDDDQLPAGFLNNVKLMHSSGASNAAGGGVIGSRSNGSVLGIDSLTNFSSYFYDPGFDSFGGTQFTWQYTMIGRSPFDSDEGGDDDGRKKTTFIGAPIVPVNVDLRNADGSIRFVNGQRLFSDATQFVKPALNSPVFSNSSYSSSFTPTQFTDAIQRAEFFNKADPNWHTLLRPRVAPARTMVLLRGTYQFLLNNDGSCCQFILVNEASFFNALFPPTASDTTTVMGAAENAGDITTKDMSSFLFPNTFLFQGNPNNCCILGFHTYDVEPGGPLNGFREKRYVMDYSSWISPGLFGPSFVDVTAMSHELSEAFNDPFVNNATPWWLAPNGLCQNNLETGDVIEGLADATIPITTNGFTYHPQNEALIQWFAGVTPSNAINHAYSYPDTGVLTAAATLQNPNCQ
jgi:hypothetical protein